MPDHSPNPGPVDRLRGRVGLALARLPGPIQVVLSARRPVVIDGQTLDPTLQLVTAIGRRKDGAAAIAATPVAFRARLRRDILSIRGPRTTVGAVRNVVVQGAGGPLDGRLYQPADRKLAPLLVFFHGGGFVAGDLDTHDEPCRLLCCHGTQAVLSVAYRLAPEHRFPAAVDDAIAAFEWAVRRATDLGVERDRVAVGGDSAGANLAAVVAQARPAGPVAQLLIYPPTDRPTRRPSHALFDAGLFLSTGERDAFYRQYTDGAAVDAGDPRISPQYGVRPGLAPALVVVAGFDVLRDEAEAYATALQAAGVRCEIQREPALGHGFINLTGVSRHSRRAVVELARRWRALLDSL